MMQRLIDANELMKLIPSEEVVSKYAVANAPTIEAIPIEWLNKHSWYAVISYWEKDQKRNSSREVLYSLLKDHGFNSYEEYINWASTIMAIPKDDRVRFLEEERENEG